MKAPQNSSKGEFIAPQASPLARQFIAQGRVIIYNPQMAPALRAALTGTNTLAKGAAVFIVQLIQRLSDKLGPLTDADFQMVVAHFAGTIANMASHLNDPDAKDPSKAAKSIIGAVMVLHQSSGQQPGGVPPGPPGAPPAGPSAGPPLGQLAGAPQ